ncbi:branched-chain acyl-CoA synthetase (ADP-forming) beta subunit / acetyl-CoA synthetase (ADP-forming) beta subunit [Staphylothermus marinus F1]|uniref:Branched-chain acyl-CoA synthetase (ADP-forming) beta subunit / acetyl-CoA synthetase (ADP-forming) beta subunit n=1 Tax=Staphylothermus marinus (strain ATCC 43588 / DSM 3639 / JCM 9404 / F1) TaxID=399550 RepID=A3DNX4_STAMF|nr:acetate--CoA ligase family protein [Staphylothermus marinus]ABN70334.1 branched-chain acyl-CoA synthetase (ADP-forming) beta subunit / acetyl-CoA synthetase (ADP-forming) beta subunit [Staphylothermus marinus F1]
MNPREIIQKAYEEKRRKLLEHEAFEIIKAYNIPAPETAIARSLEEAIKIAEKIGYPLVLKIVSPDISHKSDVGGVILNIKSKEELIKAFNKIYENVSKNAPGARIVGVLIQKMAPKGLEVIIGGLRDNIFGPVVMFGLGGIFVEVLKDVSFRIAPLTEEDAFEMMSEIKASKLLEGYRGQPPVDKKSLAKIILSVSKLLEENPEIESIDLNPVMAYPDNAVVVDARIILKT